MPTELQKAETGSQSLVFASDMKGIIFRLKEAAVYDAAEVRDELGQDDDGTPAYGRWVPAEIEDDDAFVNAPGEFIEELQRHEAEAGETFEVTRATKTGDGETDPFEVNLEKRSDDAQTRL